MNNLLLHPTTQHQLKALLLSPPHAVLIFGTPGTGKGAIADQFVEQTLGEKSLVNNPYFLEISPDSASIGIESVRAIRDFLRHKTTGKADLRRLILVKEAQTMTEEAQNALLKTLEEPPADTVVILTASDPTALKPTIRSRSQQLLVLPVSQEAAETYFKAAGFKQPAIQTAYYMSEGRVGLLKALLDGANDHELVQAIVQAKEILKTSSYDRLVQVDKLSKEKQQLAWLLQGMERVATSGLRQAVDKNKQDMVRKFYVLSKQIQQTQDALAKNANAKIVLTELFMSI